jgi:hypothetical protein
MARAVDLLSVLLLLLAACAFSAGIYSLGQEQDLGALYFLIVGALLLRAATEILRPKSSDR